MTTNEPDRLPLALLPTPLVPLDRLSGELGGVHLWMKRDDLSGLEVTGNKVRKLEYIAAEMLASGADTLVTEGTPQSNHCRAAAAICAKLGLHCTLLLRPEATDRPQGNHLLDVLFGAELLEFPRGRFEADRAGIVERVCRDLTRAGRRPRFTPMGASEPLGCWAYMRAIKELDAQMRHSGLESCDLITAVSSGGTYAGLLLGRCLYGLEHIDIWGVPVSDDVAFHQRSILSLCRATVEQFGRPVAVEPEMLRFVDGYVGPGYAIPYDEALRTIRLLARTEAVVLDPVYTGKAFTAVVDGVRAGRWGRERPAVFLHTGGVFSNFGWPDLLLKLNEGQQ